MQFLKFFLSAFLLICYSFADANEPQKEIVVVSLGSHCQASVILRDLGMRSFAGPLDWLLSLDHDAVARLINNKFEHMIDADYLVMRTPDCVINTLYNLEFRHDWSSYDLLGLLPDIADKYQRRSKRFLELSKIAKRVVFLRTVFDSRLYPVSRFPTYTTGSLVITAEQAQTLYDSLKNTFPDLNFLLAVVNFKSTDSGITENMNGILEFKVDTLIGDFNNFVPLLGDPSYFDNHFHQKNN